MKKKVLLIFSFLFISIIIIAQEPQLEWVAGQGGTSLDKGKSISIDATGNVHTIGSFSGTADFDPGIGVLYQTPTGWRETYISKLDASGNLVWLKTLVCSNSSQTCDGLSIIIDTYGNIYAIGVFVGTIDFDPGSSSSTLTSTSGSNSFILKLDASGNFIWVKHLIGSISSLALDASNNIYFTGAYGGTVDFNLGGGIYNLTSNGNSDIFILKLNTSGNFLWAKSVGGSSYESGKSISLDTSGNIVISGEFGDTSDFDPGAGVYNLTSIGDSDIYFLKLDASGIFIWAKRIGDFYGESCYDMSHDASNNICITGYFEHTVDFDPGIGVYNITSSGSRSVFVLKLASNGDFAWAKHLNTTHSASGYHLSIDASNNIYTTGYFNNTCDFDPGTGIYNLSSNGEDDIFISKLNSGGDFQWARNIGGIGDDYGHSMTIDLENNLYVTGEFENIVDFNPGAGVSNLTAAGIEDIFILKLSQPIYSVSLSSDVALASTTTPSYYSISNSYSKWGAVGVRADNANSGFWGLKFYSSDDFLNQLETSNYASGVNFVVFDQHHLTNLTRGVQTYVSGSGNARTEFEGYTETLIVGSTTIHSWPANDVIEIWDILITPGTYIFTMDYNSGSANLDMALYGSLGGPYYHNRYDYIAGSENSGTNNESFMITINNTDHYGFAIWANDANTANVTILVESVTGGTWEGNVSTNWNTAGNWNDNNVPTSTTDVIIPSGTPYSAFVNQANANAKSLTVESGAYLSIGQYDLFIQNETHIYGTFDMSNSNADMYCYGSIYWESGSQANMYANGEFRVYGNWNFQPGADVQLIDGKTWFLGTSNSYIRSYDSDCYFNDVYSQKTSGAFLGISSFSSKDLTINGDLNISSGSMFKTHSYEKIILNGSFNNNGGHFQCINGTFEFTGSPNDDLEPNVGDYFNNLTINVATDVNFVNTYSNTLVIKGDLLIQSGILKPSNNTIEIEGNWINAVGSYSFWEDVGTVIFNSSSGNQYCYAENFYNLEKSSNGGLLYFYGPVNINNNFTCNGFSWSADSSLYIDNLFLSSTGYLTANSNTTINIDDLDMGNSGSYGTLTSTGGQITIADLSDDGLYGTFSVHGSTAIIDITQGTAGGEYVDLNGSINISDGIMNVHGGSITSYWPFSNNASITMSGGVLDFTDKSIRIHNSASWSLSTNITGGVIRTDNDFQINDNFNPAGGTLEFYGSSLSTLTMNNTASALYNLHVNKTSNWVDCSSQAVWISNDVIIDGGSLGSSDTLYVGGDWTNNIGEAGFWEFNDVVCFYGNNESDITTNETFSNLAINKNCSGYTDLELLSGLQINITNDLHPNTGTFKLGDYSTVDINGDLTIESGAGVNLLNFNTSVYLAEDFIDNNSSAGNSNGFIGNKFSTLIFDGTASQDFSTIAPQILLGNITIDKPISTFVNFADDVRMLGNLNILSGGWDEYSFSNNYYLEGDFYVAADGRWTDFESTLHFEGNVLQHYEDLSTSGYLGNTTINLSNPQGGVEIHSLFKILNSHNLNINSGKIWLNGNIMRVVGDININNNGVLDLDDDSELQIGGSGQLNINAGGKLNAIGTENHEVIIKSNDASFWKFEGLSGSFVAAEWVEFSDMDEWGVNIYPGCFIDGSHPFNHCTFFEGEPNGVRFWINNNQGHYIYYANFPNQGGSLNNAAKFFDNGQITFVNYLGSFSGEAYDADPNNRINWTSNIYFTSGITDVSCYGDNDGEIDVAVTGGTSPYTYLWSDGQTIEDRSGLSSGTYSITVTDYYGGSNSESFIVSEPGYLYTIPALTIVNDVSCNGGSDGSITPSYGGGTLPYSYLWATGETTANISGLTNGVYAVTFTDANGCYMNAAWVISEPDAMYWSATTTDVSTMGGNDGAIDLAVAGGTWFYSYLWSNGATSQDISGLIAGNYTVTITDGNGCVETVSYIVNDGVQLLSITGTSTNPTCNGWYDGIIYTTASGGTPPYSYIWSDGSTQANRTGLYQGTYTVTISDAVSQTATNSWIITYPPSVYFTNSMNHVNCYGGSDGDIFVTPHGGTGLYSIVWDSGYTGFSLLNQVAGNYNCTITDTNGCLVMGGFNITEPDALYINEQITNVSIAGGSDGSIDITITGGMLYYVYNWSTGSMTEDISGLSAGFYNITITDSNNCNITETFEVTEPSAFEVQNINLTTGWSIISTYIDPTNPLVDVVFAPVASSTTLVKDGFGQVYWPNFALNMIGNMTIGQGYQVNMTSNETLIITGAAVIPELTPLLIPSGWGIIGYLRQNPGDAVAMMATIATNLIILKNGAGQVYWPNFSLNMIGNMMPGEGYQCNLNTESTLTYPVNSISLKSDLINIEPSYYNWPKITGNNMTLGIPLYAFDKIPESGSEIGVFDSYDNLVGSSIITVNNIAVAIWGNDEYSSETDGMLTGHYFNIRLWDGFSQRSVTIESWKQGNGIYEKDDVQIVGKVIVGSMNEANYYLGQNNPNPFKTETKIEFYLPKSSTISITLFDVLGNEVKDITKGSFKKGKHYITLNSHNMADGIYLYRLISNDFTATKKMKVIKE